MSPSVRTIPTVTMARKIVRLVMAIPPLVSVLPHLVGDARMQDLVMCQRRVRRRLHEHLLAAPHHVLVGHLLRADGEFGPADTVIDVAGVGADHGNGERWHTLWCVGPRPRRRQHADAAHVPDFIVEYLMRMP